jgi:hypothetical protein
MSSASIILPLGTNEPSITLKLKNTRLITHTAYPVGAKSTSK